MIEKLPQLAGERMAIGLLITKINEIIDVVNRLEDLVIPIKK